MSAWEQVASEAAGWLDDTDGPLLARYAAVAPAGPLVEIGGYAGKSACWLGSTARERGTVLFSVDWHRGSPEMLPGENCHHPEMVGDDGVFDTLPHFRRNIRRAGLEDVVIPIAGASPVVGSHWNTPIGFLFVDGAHSDHGVMADYENWAHHVVPGGFLLFHDCSISGIRKAGDRATQEGFVDVERVEDMRVLRRC